MSRSMMPKDLEFVEDFCNTAVLLHDADELESVHAANQWLTRNGWDAIRTPEELNCLRDEREAIRAFIVDRSDEAARAGLNQLARRHLSVPMLDDNACLTFMPAADAVSPISAAVAALLLHGLDSVGQRLKACAAESCHFVFYDHSRSRTRTWCDMSTCGARHKMRDYRKRIETRQS